MAFQVQKQEVGVKPREFRIEVIREPEGIYLKVLSDNEWPDGDNEVIKVREIMETSDEDRKLM